MSKTRPVVMLAQAVVEATRRLDLVQHGKSMDPLGYVATLTAIATTEVCLDILAAVECEAEEAEVAIALLQGINTHRFLWPTVVDHNLSSKRQFELRRAIAVNNLRGQLMKALV